MHVLLCLFTIIEDPLNPPTELTILEITSTSLTISWRPPQGQLEEGSAISYLINVTDPMGNSVVNEVNGTILYIRIPELIPDHVYQVAVAAVLGEVVSPSVALLVKTSPFVAGVHMKKHVYQSIVFSIQNYCALLYTLLLWVLCHTQASRCSMSITHAHKHNCLQHRST